MFLTSDPSKGRFNALLLEEGEEYVCDFAARLELPPHELSPASGAALPASLPGILRLGTLNLFWEPSDPAYPLARIPLAATTELTPFARPAKGGGAVSEVGPQHGLQLTVSQLTLMREGGHDHPYVQRRAREGAGISLSFVFDFAGPEAFLPPVQSHLSCAHLGGTEGRQIVRSMAQARESDFAFDTARLVSFDETILLDLPVKHVTPLAKEPGRLVLTDRRVYFSPLFTSFGEAAVRSHELSHTVAALRRRVALQDLGLELFYALGGGESGLPAATSPVWAAPPALQALFEFRSPSDRDIALDTLRGLPSLASALGDLREGALRLYFGDPDDDYSEWARRVSAAFLSGRVSVLDYLMFLNMLAGRTVCDLSQYPVLPWVLADYSSPELDLTRDETFRDLSKPMGALTPDRLAFFQHRYQQQLAVYRASLRDLPPHLRPSPGRLPPLDPLELPFFYGTHYSTPGYVLFWLVRAAPGHQLRLQSGRFDAPDRAFHSLPSAWWSCTEHRADVKELIPEFFLPDETFLRENEQIVLGTLQDGRAVRAVELPEWAHGSPSLFLELHRRALESDHVRRNVGRWVDLVFGSKQNGPSALEAGNVFHPLSYEGALSLETVRDIAERDRLQLQIQEFGQVPRQLFRRDHPEAAPSSPLAQQPPAFTDLPGSLLSVLRTASEAYGQDEGVRRAAEELAEADPFFARAFACPDRMPLISTFVPLSLLWGEDLEAEEEEERRRQEERNTTQRQAQVQEEAARGRAPAPAPQPQLAAQAGAALKGLWGKFNSTLSSTTGATPPAPKPTLATKAEAFKEKGASVLKGLFGPAPSRPQQARAPAGPIQVQVPTTLPPASDASLGLDPTPPTYVPLHLGRSPSSEDPEIRELFDVLRATYGEHFPELASIIDGPRQYAEVVLSIKDRTTGAGSGILPVLEVVIGRQAAELVLESARNSIGEPMDADVLETVEAVCHRIIALSEGSDDLRPLSEDHHTAEEERPETVPVPSALADKFEAAAAHDPSAPETEVQTAVGADPSPAEDDVESGEVSAAAPSNAPPEPPSNSKKVQKGSSKGGKKKGGTKAGPGPAAGDGDGGSGESAAA